MHKPESSTDNKLLNICEILQYITFAISGLSILLPLLFWNQIPDTIPSHYRVSGIADAYSTKGGLFLLFLVVLFLLGLTTLSACHIKFEATSEFAREKEKKQLELDYPITIYLGFISQCCFAYIIFCTATCRNLGGWFTIISLIATFVPLVSFFIRYQLRP